ncbi:MAG: transcriptional regulator, MarR family [Mycobacterium sp.]|jgi:DNA-binding MarR family transcriptional regulator|nr:transcriptional regulator, MarR family [Mycobacterium sp.]
MGRRRQLEDRIIDAMGLLMRTSESYLDDLAASFAAGLHRGTVLPLTVLHRIGPARVSELADALGLDRTTVTRHLDVLERRGLVDRRPDERDRRAMHISLTPKAATHLDAMRATNRQRIKGMCSDWTPEERQSFANLLTKFAQHSHTRFLERTEDVRRQAL